MKPRFQALFCFAFLAFSCGSSPAATVRFAWTNSVGNPDTNWFIVYPVGDVAQADGSFITKGPVTRLTPNASGLVTNTFEVGTYVASNRFLGRGIAFRVPNDHGPTVYCATCGTNNTPAGTGLAISGFNYFITITYGTNPPPTYDEITNSLGFLPMHLGQSLTNKLYDISGNTVVDGLYFTLIDPSTGWTNANWSDQTLSTANTNVLDWFNQWLIGTWTANGLLFTNIPRSGVTGLESALSSLSNTITSGSATNAIANNQGSGTNTTLYGTTAADSVVATNFTGNGAAVTNLTAGNIALNPQILLDPPHIGPSSNTGPHTLTGNNSAGVKLAGAGIARSIWGQIHLGSDSNLNSNLKDLRLQGFPDSGGTTNLAFLAVDFSLADLFCNRFRFPTNGHWAIDRDSWGVFTSDRSTNLIYGGYIKTFELRLPMPFTNGLLVRITNAAAGSLWNLGYININSQPAADLSALGAYQTWRLRSKTTTSATAGGASNFLFAATGPGMCVGWMQSLFDSNNQGLVVFLDSISTTFYTGPGVTWSVSGGDDLSLQTYAMKGGVSFGTYGGVMNRWFGPSELNPDQQSAVEFYRWFPRDAIHWTNGVSVYIPDSEAISAMSATMFYYAP